MTCQRARIYHIEKILRAHWIRLAILVWTNRQGDATGVKDKGDGDCCVFKYSSSMDAGLTRLLGQQENPNDPGIDHRPPKS